MEVRVARLEEAVPRIEPRLDWQIPAVIGATVTLLIGFWAPIQYMHARGLL